ncbi:MAG: sulfatase-like hydrolase/transferase [Akkermansiaceae bacterium]|nr:sulfatase-like hydrolase/transferase [Akkermansiaceae bacterium]
MLLPLICGGITAAASSLHAGITIQNHSFESDIIARDGNTATVASPGDDYNNSIVPTGWIGFDDGRGGTAGNRGIVSHAGDSFFHASLTNTPDTDANDQSFFTAARDIYQVLSTTLAPNTTYTLTVDIGDRDLSNSGGDPGSPIVHLGYGSATGQNILLTLDQASQPAQVNGNWVTWTAQITTGEAPAGEGQPLRIELTNGASVGWFDNVRLVNDPCPPEQPPIPIDVYLLGGQSNMQGVGRQSKLPAELTSIPSIKFYHSSSVTSAGGANHWISLQPAGFDASSFGPEITFGEICADYVQGTQVALIKHAAGGTSLISNWKPGADASDTGNWGNQFSTFVSTVNNAIAALEADGYAPVIRGMVWQQGERDATSVSDSNAYGTNLSHFIGRIREQFSSHASPDGIRFVAGQVLPYAPAGGQVVTDYPGYLTVRQAILDADENSGAALSVANTASIPTNSTDHPTHEQEIDGYRDTDEVHLNAEAQINLGRAMAYQMLKLTTTITDDFNVDPIDPDWTPVIGPAYTQANGVLTSPSSTAATVYTHKKEILTSAPFSLSVEFTFDAKTGAQNWAGLTWGVGGSGLGDDANDFYVFRVRGSNGRVTMSRFDNNSTQYNLDLTNTGTDLGPLFDGNTYRLTLNGNGSGSYTGSLIDVTGGDSGTAGSTMVTLSGTDTTLTGGDYGLYSNVVGADDLHFDDFSVVGVTLPPPPAAPTGLVALSSPGSVTLDWDDNTEADLEAYKVYRKEGAGGFALLATVTAPTSAYTDSGISSGVIYTYQVTALDSDGSESAVSNQAVGSFSIDLSPNGNKPNVIIVLADDQGWGDTGYNGHGVVLTPSLDAMAADGYVFHRFYAAAPVCSPSRAGLLTGRHPIRCKVPNHGRYMREQEMTMAEAFKGAGYVTGMFGKVHLGSGQPDSPANPSAMGFDEWVIGLNYFDNNPYLSRNGVVEHPTGKGTEITMDEAIGFLNTHKNGPQPMFATIWFPSPHSPHEEVPDGSTLYSGDSNAGYYREITLLDENVGRLRQWLKDNSIDQNTILWFCSDNGGLLTASSGGRDKKGSIYEGGLRVPAIVEWPARNLKGATSVPVVHSDMYPTLLAMAGVTVENQLPLDGVNVTDVIEGDVSSRPPIGFWHLFQDGEATYSDATLSAIMNKQQAGDPTPHDAYRIKKDIDEFPRFSETASPGHAAWLSWPWKLHRINDTTYELYNLESDPMESNNLAGAPEHAQRLSDMQTELHAWQQSVVRSINGADYGQLDMWLPMNRTEGIEAFDASGEKRGDLIQFADNSSHWVAGKHNRALEFDGVDDQVEIPNANFSPPVGGNARTVTAWIKTTGGGVICTWGDPTINGGLWEMSVDANGRLHLDVASGSITGQTDLRDGLWHHIAVVLADDGSPDVTEGLLYVDGAAETISASAAQAVTTSNSKIYLGGARVGSAQLSIDEFRIAPRALTPAEVTAEANATGQAAAAWLFRNFGSVAAVDWTSDSDGDGVDLLTEYALGMNPLVADHAQSQIIPTYNASTQKLEVTYPQRNDGTHDLGYGVQVSRDLTDWTLPWTLKSTADHPTLDHGEFHLRTIETDASLTSEERLFMRLLIAD